MPGALMGRSSSACVMAVDRRVGPRKLAAGSGRDGRCVDAGASFLGGGAGGLVSSGSVPSTSAAGHPPLPSPARPVAAPGADRRSAALSVANAMALPPSPPVLSPWAAAVFGRHKRTHSVRGCPIGLSCWTSVYAGHTQCPEGGSVLLEEAAFRSSLQSEARGKTLESCLVGGGAAAEIFGAKVSLDECRRTTQTQTTQRQTTQRTTKQTKSRTTKQDEMRRQ